jgi:hypothetical protein
MKLPIYDEFIKKYPPEIISKFVRNVANTDNSRLAIDDFTKAVEKLKNKYPDLKTKIGELIYGVLPKHSGPYRIASRMHLIVDALKNAEMYAMNMYGDDMYGYDIINSENIDQLLKAIETTNNEIASILERGGPGRPRLSYNNSRTLELLHEQQKVLYNRAYKLDPDNKTFIIYRMLYGPLINMKKSNFKNTETNLLTMPSREEELKNLFKGGKTRRNNKKSRKTRKNK